MITALTRLTQPLSVEEVARYLGIADTDNPLLPELLNECIELVERVTGLAVGRVRVEAVISPPVPRCILLPYSPLQRILTIARRQLTEQEEEVLYEYDEQNPTPPPVVVKPNVLTEVVVASVLTTPDTVLRLEYEGGADEPDYVYRGLILRTVAAAWQNRAVRPTVDRFTIDDPRYIAVWL